MLSMHLQVNATGGSGWCASLCKQLPQVAASCPAHLASHASQYVELLVGHPVRQVIRNAQRSRRCAVTPQRLGPAEHAGIVCKRLHTAADTSVRQKLTGKCRLWLHPMPAWC